MLMWMKSYVEGMRSFVYYVGNCFDHEAIAADDAERERWQGLIELLTPVVKAYCTDKAFEVLHPGGADFWRLRLHHGVSRGAIPERQQDHQHL